jgi:hypothetical protein
MSLSSKVLEPYLEHISPEDKPKVQSILADLLLYQDGHLSYEHLNPFPKVLLSNKLSTISVRADPTNLKYIGVYGWFIYDNISVEKLRNL